MKSVFLSSIFLYLGDVMMVALLFAGTGFTVGAIIRHSRRFVVLDITERNLRQFAAFQIIWLSAGLILFKFVVLQGGIGIHKSILTGNHGSLQFSTAGEAAAALLALYGFYRITKSGTKHVRVTAREQREWRLQFQDSPEP